MPGLNLFTYGTLLDPRVFARVSGGRRRRLPASMAGFRAGPLPGTPYLIAEPECEARLPGALYLNLSPNQVKRLDIYEGRAYRRLPAIARAGRRYLPAHIYVRQRDYT